MFDDEDTVAFFNESVEDGEEFLDVGEMETG